MKGFFTKEEITSSVRPDGKTYSCISCGLYKDCKSPKMKAFGNFKKGILNIGEAPGEVEDAEGKQFVGRTGKLLQNTYKSLGIDLFEDCLNFNSVNCRPMDNKENNRTPTNYELDCCKRFVYEVINLHKPKVTILLGNSAIYSVIGGRWKKDLGGIMKWRGWTIPDQYFNSWICPTFHPSYIDRVEDPVMELIWKQDLEQAFNLHEVPVSKHVEPNIKIIDDLYMLTNIKNSEVAVDFETTGLKPHYPGHRIVCCAIAPSENSAYVFMIPNTKSERKPLIDLLADENIGKIAHNMKFEHSWSLVRLGTEIKNWAWDTMLASHVLDNRTGITGLKFQVFVNFGIADYSSEVNNFLTCTEDPTNANSMNKINKLLEKPDGKRILLTYCGLDAIYEYRLAAKQRENIIQI